MAAARVDRRLAAILAADVVGYSRLIERDEAGTLERLKEHRKSFIEPLIAEHHGRVVKLMGDGALCEFSSVVAAVQCAVLIQKGMAERETGVSVDQKIRFRIGINLGDVVHEEGDLYGDGVNVAARLEQLAEPGGIAVSGTAHDHLQGKLGCGFAFLGEQRVKNIERPVRVYRVLLDPAAAGKVIGERRGGRIGRRWLVVVAATVVILTIGSGVLLWPAPWRAPPAVESASLERMAFPLPDKPSLAVLPFANLSGDAKEEYLADGITEGIITSLSKVPNLFVIARNSTFAAYRGKTVPVRQVAEEQGVRYVLEGSVQRSGDRMRVRAQLVDALTGYYLWAEEYDRTFQDIFDLQDAINQQVMTELQVELTYGEEVRLRRRSTTNPQAFQLYLQGIELHRKFGRLEMAEAAALFEKAIALDPNFTTAWLVLGTNYAVRGLYGWLEDREGQYAHAAEIAEKVLAIDAANAEAYGLLGWVRVYQGRHDEAIAFGEKAVALAPNHATLIMQLARNLIYAGRIEEAVPLIQKAMRLSPYYPAWYLQFLGKAHYVRERYNEAIAALLKYRERNPTDPDSLAELAHVYAAVGRLDEARALATELRRENPGYRVQLLFELFKDPAIRERIAQNLRAAGLEP